MKEPKAELVFEVSWEVCNKVGGIWTVISSKANQIKKYYGNNYICVGPFFADKLAGQFEENPTPEDCKDVCKELTEKGIVLHFGKWLIKGEPKTILVDYTNFRFNTDQIKKELWESFQVDSLYSNNAEYNEPLVWSYACGIAIEKLAKLYNKKAVAQFHEWLAGAGLLYLRKNDIPVGTVFTTHATVMGRALASANVDLFYKPEGGERCNLELIDIDKKSYEFHTEGKHLIEKASANNADVFTTVSEITGMEAGYVLKRKPDKLLSNGLDIDKFPTFEEASIEHRRHRGMIREFMIYYFFPYYQFDIKNTLFFFLAGRYEFRDKGIDVYIQALARLNDRLKLEKSDKTIVAFIWVPAGVKGINQDILENRTLFNDIKDGLDEEMDNIHKNILYDIVSRKKIVEGTVLSKNFIEETKKKVMKFKKKGIPPIVTHDLLNYGDTIVEHLLKSGLDNMDDDRVKMIFYPIYLTGADGLLDLTYYEAMQGGHLGVFPSFYEPWGYTPLEAAALGVSSVTTDLAGFGRYILRKKERKYPGIFVLKRMDRTDEQIINDLTNFMYKFTKFSKQERAKNKIEAKKIAGFADWKHLVMNYIDSHNLAFEKRFS